jgi:hypothetical protein
LLKKENIRTGRGIREVNKEIEMNEKQDSFTFPLYEKCKYK